MKKTKVNFTHTIPDGGYKLEIVDNSPNTCRLRYCQLIIELHECRWWQVFKQTGIRGRISYMFPLMRAESQNS